MSWSNNKELLSGTNAISWNSLFKKKKNIYIYISKLLFYFFIHFLFLLSLPLCLSLSLSFLFFKHLQPHQPPTKSQYQFTTETTNPPNHKIKSPRRNQTTKPNKIISHPPKSNPKISHTCQTTVAQTHTRQTATATLVETRLKSIRNGDPRTHQIKKLDQLVKIKPQNPPKSNHTAAHTCRTTEPWNQPKPTKSRTRMIHHHPRNQLVLRRKINSQRKRVRVRKKERGDTEKDEEAEWKRKREEIEKRRGTAKERRSDKKRKIIIINSSNLL